MMRQAPLELSDRCVPNWQAPSLVRALFTVRAGGVSQGPFGALAGRGGLNLGAYCGDAAEAVIENRTRLAASLPGVPVWLRQVHGTQVVKVWDKAQDGGLVSGECEPEADAAVTDRRGLVLAVLTADCLPVLFCDDQARVVGVAHAGWRGLAAGVLEATVAAMRERLSPGRPIMAWFGPAIGPNAFEVGDDVLAAFVRANSGAKRRFRAGQVPGKWYADLPGLAFDRLKACGVETVHASELCTFSDASNFFSHRRDRITGRQACLIWLAP